MRIYPVVSNEIKVELEDGTLFELHEGTRGLSIMIRNYALVVSTLNAATYEQDEVWKGYSINLTKAD